VKANLGDLIVLVQKVSRAYMRVIRLRIAETRKALGTTGEDTEEDTEKETS
jgi:hypothetical protein